MQSDIERELKIAAQKLGSHNIAQKKQHKRRVFLLGACIGLLLLSILGILLLLGHQPTPSSANSPSSSGIIPKNIRSKVNFSIVYPDLSKLPKDYSLDQNSFSATNQTVLYSVSYEQTKKIAFTVQAKPTENELKTFYANQLPLRNELRLPLGTAVIGVLNNQTLVSLPTNKNSWLIITAPVDIDQGDLEKVLRSLQEG